MEILLSPFNLQDILWILLTFSQMVFLLIVGINFRYVKSPSGTPVNPPLVSVMIPLRNESENVNDLVKALIQQDYPNLEILLLDDKSEDDTWLKMLSMQWMHPSLLLFQGQELPKGWLGKNFACHQLAQKARGELLLFIDADVRPLPSAISRSIATLQSQNLDFLSIFPEQKVATSYQKRVLPLMDFFLYTFLPFPLIRKTHSPSFTAANGQWMLFKRSAYDVIGGHESVKNKVIEDMALARNLKSNGLKMNTFTGRDTVACLMYPDDATMKTGFGKNIFAASGYHAVRLTAFLFLLFVVFISPYIWFPLYPAGIINIFIILSVRALLARKFGHSVKEAVWLHPVALWQGILLALDSMKQYKRKQASWKGRNLQSV
jgi:chlorobactene glucosyltransferase